MPDLYPRIVSTHSSLGGRLLKRLLADPTFKKKGKVKKTESQEDKVRGVRVSRGRDRLNVEENTNHQTPKGWMEGNKVFHQGGVSLQGKPIPFDFVPIQFNILFQ